ncbi:hypothetical protein [Providencia sp. PROV255]|uniref:hypothetical protein n=1 Tax=Providencia sp. PROV255 TaxID=2949943 RepID=UPI00234998C7|nr:hypothetical protein [Providencia sp. PROV255]
MWQTFKNLMSDPLYSGSAGISIGLIGILLAIFFYIKSEAKPKLSSAVEFRSLIGKEHSELSPQISVLFEGKQVDSVSSSEFVIWNSGKSVIDKSALDTKQPLRITFKDSTQILRYQIKNINSETVSPALKLQDGCIFIEFDFIEKNEGFRIEILHTGDYDSLALTGKLKGVLSPFDKPVPSNNFNGSALIEQFVLFLNASALKGLAIIGGISTVILISTFYFPESANLELDTTSFSLLSVIRVYLALVIFSAIFAYFLTRSYPANLKIKKSE